MRGGLRPRNRIGPADVPFRCRLLEVHFVQAGDFDGVGTCCPAEFPRSSAALAQGRIHQPECRGRPTSAPLWQKILAVAEFARIRASCDCPNSGDFGYAESRQDFRAHRRHRRGVAGFAGG